MLDLGGVGTFLVGIAAVVGAVQSSLAKREATLGKREASRAHLATLANGKAVAVVRADVKELTVNTNGKMQETLDAVRAQGVANAEVAGLEGERSGIATGVAQEVARQKKETT